MTEKINKNAKNQLAKLLATENLYVEHRNVQTASFDTKRRRLILPQWKDMSEDLYDMLIGHEVGHALETPNLEEAMPPLIQYVDPTHPKRVQMFMNIIEDARIEKHIKRRYPGMRNSFFKGYQEALDRDIFKLEGKDIDKDFNFIDRVNLYFKLGSHMLVKFTPEEQHYVDMVENCYYWDDVCEAVKQVYDFMKEELTKKKKQKTKKKKGDITGGSGSSGQEESENEDPEEEDEEEESKVVEASADESDVEDEGKEIELEDEGSSPDDDKEDSEEEENLDPITDETWEKEKQKFVVFLKEEILYANIPKTLKPEFIIQPKQILAAFGDGKDHVVTANTFRTENEKIINFMVNEFEMKKAADEHTRSTIAKTGIIDTNKLHSYKYNDDIFRRVSSVPVGKNHGLVMFIDWSTSMDDNMVGTIEQLLVLILFCKKVQIPFSVYAFSNRDISYEEKVVYMQDDLCFNNFKLINFFNPSMSFAEYTNMFNVLIGIRSTFGMGGGHRLPKGYATHGTPLNQAIIASYSIISEFQQKFNVQIINAVFLTDGESELPNGIMDDKGKRSTHFSYSGFYEIIMRDPVTKLNYTSKTSYEITKNLFQVLRDRMDVNLVGFYIAGGMMKSYFQGGYFGPKFVANADAMQAEYSEKGYVTCHETGYDEQYVILGGHHLKILDKVLKLTGEKLEDRSKEFSEFSKSKMEKRVFLKKFIETIAK